VKASTLIYAEMYLLVFSLLVIFQETLHIHKLQKYPPPLDTFGQTIHPSFDEIGCNKLPAFFLAVFHVSQKKRPPRIIEKMVDGSESSVQQLKYSINL